MPSVPVFSYNPSNCGALFTTTFSDDNSELAQFDIPATTQTEEVCETWTGNDYLISSTSQDASDNLAALPEDVMRVDYQGGYITAMTAGGSAVESPEPVDQSLFDFVTASSAERQASIDAPYYGIYGGGGGGGEECPPGEPNCHEMQNLVAGDDQSVSQAPAPFTRHGITRRGVRALIDDAEEQSRGPQGVRRFRVIRGGQEVIYSLDPVLQLIVGEDVNDDSTRVRTRHTWSKSGAKYVRTRTDVEATSVRNGHQYTDRMSVVLSNVHINGVRIY
jgi:hypothetical protein